MFKCPNCGEDTIPRRDKILFSSLYPTKCTSCGIYAGNSCFDITLIMLPWFIVMFSMNPWVDGVLWWLALVFACATLGSYSTYELARLVRVEPR